MIELFCDICVAIISASMDWKEIPFLLYTSLEFLLLPRRNKVVKLRPKATAFIFFIKAIFFCALAAYRAVWATPMTAFIDSLGTTGLASK